MVAVFNCCHSHVLAEKCSEHILAAIGMDGAIADVAAKDFAARFYASIGFGQDVHQAFDRAVTQLEMKHPGEAHIPQIYVKTLQPDHQAIVIGH